MLERIWNLASLFTIVVAIITIVAIFYPSIWIVPTGMSVGGLALVVWEIKKSSIGEIFWRTYDDFKKDSVSDLWEERLPPYTIKRKSNAVNFQHCIEGQRLKIITHKQDVGFKGSLSWEGPELVARKSSYNAVRAKIRLVFDESDTGEGNIYLCGRGRIERFHYLLGIDKSSRDVFFHIWDKEREAKYGPPEVGSYIKERGRTHLKDYLEKAGERFLELGIEWGFDGPKFFAVKEDEKDFIKIPANPPPGIRDKILKDSKLIYLHGLREFAIRTDLKVKGQDFKTLIGEVEHVKTKRAIF